MQNALFVGVSSQVALQRELDVIANNMANVSTTGFKGRSSRFQEYLMPVASADSFQRQDRRVSYVIDQGTALDLAQGPIEQTGNPLHVAVRGEAFLVVRTPTGDRYTRNGAFETDPQGNLVTSDGYAVQGEGGPIQINPPGNRHRHRSGRNGLHQSRHPWSRADGDLPPTRRPSPTKAPTSIRPKAAPVAAGVNGRLESGALERSNVKPVIEMTRLMDVNRTYTMVSGVISRLDELRGTAIRRLADVA